MHPYDIDPDEPFSVMPHAGWVVSRIVHTRRGVTLGRLDAVLEAAEGPAGRWVRSPPGWTADLPTITPPEQGRGA